jgi:asparagine synthase (glutamine-hydrolysing)
MVEPLRHENFYVTGTWTDKALGIYVGWSARKNSFADDMPIRNETGDVTLVFSGEEFPEPDTARRLRERGHRLELDGPSYLVHVYEEDPSFPRGLNGRFHGLLTDRARGTAVLFNDRYGMHRLYYHESQDALYFAAEAKAILAVRPELRSVDPRGLGEFVSCGCVLENRTIFQGIRLLPPASAWVIREGMLQSMGTYFQPREWEEQDPLEPEAYYRELRGALVRALPRYFGGHEPIGVALTGGLDTRMIMAWRNPAPHTLPCYTFGSMRRDTQDVRVARQVAAHCGQPHEVITVGDGFLSDFPAYAERSVYLTDGCVEPSRASDLYASQRARQIAPVKIVGTYGSELLGQVPTFGPVLPTAGLFSRDLLSEVRTAESTYTKVRREHPVTFAAFRQSPWSHFGVMALEQTQLSVRSPYLDNEFVRVIYRMPAFPHIGGDVRRRLISEGNPALAELRTDRGVGPRGPIAAASRWLLEFTFRAEHVYDYAMPQWLARVDHGLSALHPESAFLGRHKPSHFRIWYRGILSGYVRDTLLDSRARSRSYLERNGLEVVVRRHLIGDRNYTGDIHKALALELVHRIFIDSR